MSNEEHRAREREHEIRKSLQMLHDETHSALSSQKAFINNDLHEMRLYWKDDEEISKALMQLEKDSDEWCKAVSSQSRKHEEHLMAELQHLKKETQKAVKEKKGGNNDN